MQINVRTDFLRLRDTLNEFGRNQMPFAAARALTAVAREVAEAETKALSTQLDRPTPFTMRAFGVLAASKTSLTATVFAKDIQAAYLHRVEMGGVRTPPKKALVLPVGVRLNQFGNIPKGSLKRAQAQRRVFAGTVNGTGGIWQRMKPSRVKLLASFKPRAAYQPTLGYRARLPALVARAFPEHMGAALEQAMRTARR